MQFSWQRLLPSFFKKENWCTEKLTNLSWVTGNENWDWIKICWTLMCMFFFFFNTRLLSLNSEVTGSSKYNDTTLYLPRTSFDHNYLWQNTPFFFILLETAHLISLWSKLRGICREDMEGKLMGTTHKSSTSAHAIIYRSAYFRSAQFWFH